MDARTPECSVIIPVFNKWELTGDCLKSLREHSSEHDLEVIVVDNASSDATITELEPLGKALFGERFTAVRFSENKNFGPGCNAGAEAATAPFLFFLNNDTLLTPGWFPPLIRALNADETLGAVGPLLLYGDNTVQHLGVAYIASGSGVHLYRSFPRDHPVVSKSRKFQSLTGAALLLRADLFRRCGEFYQGYKNGYEDQELCARIRQHGKTLRCIPESVVYHLESQSSGRHDDENHNLALFRGRCRGLVHTDIHHHVMRDGFTVFIDDLLSICPAMSEEDRAALAARAKGLPLSELLPLAVQNPYWPEGYERIAEFFERADNFDHAIAAQIKLAEIQPTISRYMNVRKLLEYVPAPPWKDLFENKLAAMKQYAADKHLALRKVNAVRNYYRSGHDPFLEALYARKLKKMFP